MIISKEQYVKLPKRLQEHFHNGNFHPTVKSLKLMEYLVKLVTLPDGIVLDPFLGSGTTAVACKKLNKGCIGIELNQEYVDIANARIKATIVSGSLFD